MSTSIPIITIDGPSGTGKGTLAQRLSHTLGWHLLDSGALYRVLAVAAQQHAVTLDNEQSLAVLAAHMDVQFVVDSACDGVQIVLEGESVTTAVRSETIASEASQVAALRVVREALVERQRAFCQAPGLVADGRDMGTVIFPEARLKLFLTAAAEVRVERRYNQLKNKGVDVRIDQLRAELASRDKRDAGRECAPLMPAEAAVVIDTTALDIDAVYTRAMDEVTAIFAGLASS